MKALFALIAAMHCQKTVAHLMLEETYNHINCSDAVKKEMRYVPVQECISIGGLQQSVKVECPTGHNPILHVYKDSSCVTLDVNFTDMHFVNGTNSLPGECQPWGEDVYKRFTCPVTPGYLTMAVYTDAQCMVARTGADALMQLPLKTCSWKYLKATQAVLKSGSLTVAAPDDRQSWQAAAQVALIPGTSKFDVVGDKDEEFELGGITKGNFTGEGTGSIKFLKERSGDKIYLKATHASKYLAADGTDVVLSATKPKIEVEFYPHPDGGYGQMSATRFSTRSDGTVGRTKYISSDCTGAAYANSIYDTSSCIETEIVGNLAYMKLTQVTSQMDAIWEQFTTTTTPNTTAKPKAHTSGSPDQLSRGLWVMSLIVCARLMAF